MDVNKLLNPVLGRIISDYGDGSEEEPEAGSLHDLLDMPIQAVKGPRKRTGMDNPCFTIFVLSNPRMDDVKAHNGTMVINFYADNHTEGHANIELLGPVAERIIQLFDDIEDNRLEVDGYVNYNLVITAADGPLHDPDDEGAHFMSVRFNFGIIERSA